MTTASAVTATAFAAVVMAVIVIMAVTLAAAATAVVMVVVVTMVMAVLAVNVAVSQFFSRCFADRDHFYVEVQILASQHVVTVNHYVVAVNFGDFYRNRTLIGVSQETHTDFQLFNTHEHVFRNALNQVFVVVAVSVVGANVHVEFVTDCMTIQRGFQTGDQGTMTVQII